MKYYYLNNEKKPVGPHTLNEIQNLMQAGVINEETLAAVAGDSKWKPLSELVENCSTWNNGTPVESTVPVAVQEVKEGLSLWGCFTRGFKLYATFKGRASRKEFWGFYLFYVIIGYAVSILTDLVTKIFMPATLEEAMDGAMGVEGDLGLGMKVCMDYFTNPLFLTLTIISCLISLFMFIPFVSVSVRRLHDTGSNATGVVLGCAALAWMYGSLGYLVMVLVDSPDLTEDFSVFVPFILSLLFFLMVSLYLFIMMLIPGNVGENKYGPQPKN